MQDRRRHLSITVTLGLIGFLSGCASSQEGGGFVSDASSEVGSDAGEDAGDDGAMPKLDSGGGMDATAGDASDSGSSSDTGSSTESGPLADAGADVDAGTHLDSGTHGDSGPAKDSGPPGDSGPSGDASPPDDGSSGADSEADAGNGDAAPDGGASCNTPGDCPPTGNACVVATCINNQCGTTSQPEGTSCGAGGLVCDDTGKCTSSIVVVRVGDGAAALSSVATAVFLEQRYVSDGALVPTSHNPLALPTAVSGSNARLTVSGSATSEGALELSADGHYVTLAGYDADQGTAGVASSTSVTINRIAGRVDASGNVDTSTRIDALISGNNVRSAATSDGTSFWVGGATSGVVYIALGATGGTSILASPGNVRVVDVFGGQLYGSSGSANFTNVFAVGTGLPTTTATEAALAGMPTTGASPYAFAIVAGNVLYVADDRAVASGGGVQKWTLSAGTWTLTTTFNGGLTAGARGVTAFATGSTVTVVASVAATSANTLVAFVDDGVNLSPAATVLATAATNTVFRGVAPAPQ